MGRAALAALLLSVAPALTASTVATTIPVLLQKGDRSYLYMTTALFQPYTIVCVATVDKLKQDYINIRCAKADPTNGNIVSYYTINLLIEGT